MKTILIIERLFIYFEVDTSVALANRLGVSATTLSNWKSRNTIDYEILFTKCEGINLNWLFLGQGEMRVHDYGNKSSPNILNEGGTTYGILLEEKNKVIKAQEETIKIEQKYIRFLEAELKQKKPVENGQKRKVG